MALSNLVFIDIVGLIAFWNEAKTYIDNVYVSQDLTNEIIDAMYETMANALY